MKTNGIIFTLALVLAGLLTDFEARAAGVWRVNQASDPNDPRSKAFLAQKKAAAEESCYPGEVCGPEQGQSEPCAGPAKGGSANNPDKPVRGDKDPVCKPNPDKEPGSNLNKYCGALKLNRA